MALFPSNKHLDYIFSCQTMSIMSNMSNLGRDTAHYTGVNQLFVRPTGLKALSSATRPAAATSSGTATAAEGAAAAAAAAAVTMAAAAAAAAVTMAAAAAAAAAGT